MGGKKRIVKDPNIHQTSPDSLLWFLLMSVLHLPVRILYFPLQWTSALCKSLYPWLQPPASFLSRVVFSPTKKAIVWVFSRAWTAASFLNRVVLSPTKRSLVWAASHAASFLHRNVLSPTKGSIVWVCQQVTNPLHQYVLSPVLNLVPRIGRSVVKGADAIFVEMARSIGEIMESIANSRLIAYSRSTVTAPWRLIMWSTTRLYDATSPLASHLAKMLYRCNSICNSVLTAMGIWQRYTTTAFQLYIGCPIANSMQSVVTQVTSGLRKLLITTFDKLLALSQTLLFSPLSKYLLCPLGTHIVAPSWSRCASSASAVYHFFSAQRLAYRRRFRKGISQNDFTLHVPQGELVERKRGNFIVMKNNTSYSFTLSNDNDYDANCSLSVDGKCVGRLRMQPHSQYTIERPTNSNHKFCFVRENTVLLHGQLDKISGVVTGASQNGVITAHFVPCFPPSRGTGRLHECKETDRKRVNVPSREHNAGTATLDQLDVRLQLWDTAGQERFRALGPIYFRGAQGAVIVYDITDKESFQSAKHWYQEVRKFAGDNVNVILAANKTDLDLKLREVSSAEGMAWAQEMDLLYFETSAKTGSNVQDMFQALAESVDKPVDITKGSLTCIVKVILLGGSGVGKTSLMTRFTQNSFSHQYNSTIGASFQQKSLSVSNAKVKLMTHVPAGRGFRSNVTQGGRARGRARAARGNVSSRKQRKSKKRGFFAASGSMSCSSVSSGQDEWKAAADEDEAVDETATGATTYRGHSTQKFRHAAAMVENTEMAVETKVVMLLERQYNHQLQLEKVLIGSVGYPQMAINIIGEYLYTHSVLETH